MTNLEFLKHPLCVFARKLMEEEFEKKRKEGTLSLPHDNAHCKAVAVYAGVTAQVLSKALDHDDLVYRPAVLAGIAGYLHDIRREPKETEPHGPKGAEFVHKLYTDGVLGELSPDEFNAVYEAIEHHEEPLPELLKKFGDPITDQREPIFLPVIPISLKTGDGALEASGYRVLERRAFFVGNERMRKGDLRRIFKYPKESHIAWLGEYFRRVYDKLPIDSYPLWLRPIGEKLHAVQYWVAAGLLAFVGWNEVEAAKEIEKRGFPKFEGIVEKVKAQRHLDGNYFDPNEFPVLAAELKKIRNLSEDDRKSLGEGAYLVVHTIATAKTPEDGLNSYKFGTNPYADEFFRGMIDYREGRKEFVACVEELLNKGIKKVRET